MRAALVRGIGFGASRAAGRPRRRSWTAGPRSARLAVEETLAIRLPSPFPTVSRLPSHHEHARQNLLAPLLVPTVVFLLFAGKLGAMELREIPLPPIAPAPQAIIVDGKLDEWKAVGGYNYKPFDQVSSAKGDPAMESLLNDPVSANVKFCYDADALFVAVEWKDHEAGTNRGKPGQPWSPAGEGFALHLLTDQVLHLACWPSADGKELHVMGRYGNEQQWQDMKAVAAAGLRSGDGKSCAQELRIPWKLVTKAGKAPANGRMELGIDLAWNAIPATLAERFRRALDNSLNAGRGVSLSFLTARPNLAGAGYLPSPSEWGELIFAAAPGGDDSQQAADGSTSLTEMGVPLAAPLPAIRGALTGWDAKRFQTAGYLRALWGDRFAGA